MNKTRTELNLEAEIVGVDRIDAIFVREDGKDIPYHFYKVRFKVEGNDLVLEAKVDKVFNDYVEN